MGVEVLVLPGRGFVVVTGDAGGERSVISFSFVEGTKLFNRICV